VGAMAGFHVWYFVADDQLDSLAAGLIRAVIGYIAVGDGMIGWGSDRVVPERPSRSLIGSLPKGSTDFWSSAPNTSCHIAN
jgi:hypothetical protein